MHPGAFRENVIRRHRFVIAASSLILAACGSSGPGLPPPANVHGVRVPTGGILFWDPVPKASAYVISANWRGAGGVTQTQRFSALADATSLGLGWDSTFASVSMSIHAIEGNDDGKESASLSFPDAFATLHASSAPGQVALDWAMPKEWTGPVTVGRSTAGANGETIATVSGGAASFVDTTVDPDTTYAYSILVGSSSRDIRLQGTVSVGKNNRGSLTFHFYSAEDLDRLLELMRVPD